VRKLWASCALTVEVPASLSSSRKLIFLSIYVRKYVLFFLGNTTEEPPSFNKGNSAKEKTLPIICHKSKPQRKSAKESPSLFLVLVLASAQATRAAGRHQTDLLTGDGVPLDSGGVTDVLMVTTSVRVLNGVHRHTSHLGPSVALSLKKQKRSTLAKTTNEKKHKLGKQSSNISRFDLVLVERSSSLEHGLVVASSSGSNAHHGAAIGADDLLGPRGQADAGHTGIGVVGDDRGIVSRSAGEFTAISRAGLRVAHNSS